VADVVDADTSRATQKVWIVMKGLDPSTVACLGATTVGEDDSHPEEMKLLQRKEASVGVVGHRHAGRTGVGIPSLCSVVEEKVRPNLQTRLWLAPTDRTGISPPCGILLALLSERCP
jgi:hypothetical protein